MFLRELKPMYEYEPLIFDVNHVQRWWIADPYFRCTNYERILFVDDKLLKTGIQYELKLRLISLTNDLQSSIKFPRKQNKKTEK